MDLLRAAGGSLGRKILAAVGIIDTMQNPGIAPQTLMRIGLSAAARPAALATLDAQALLALALDNGSVLVTGVQIEAVFPPIEQQETLQDDEKVIRRCIAARQGDKLLAVTAGTVLAVWHLDKVDQPPLCVHLRTQATAIHMSPLSPWIAVGLISGAVHLIDAVTGAVADYVIPAPQTSSEQKGATDTISTSDLHDAETTARESVADGSSVMSVAFSPTDPNLLLIAYKSGILIIWDLAQKTSRKRFVYAPSSNSLTVLCLAACWRPDGEQIVASHADGRIVFWSLKDEWMASLIKKDEIRKPLHVRTFLTGSAPPGKDLQSTEIHPIVQLTWASCGDLSQSHNAKHDSSAATTHSVLAAAGGLPASGPNGFACLVFTPKSDLNKRRSITELHITTSSPVNQIALLKPIAKTSIVSFRDSHLLHHPAPSLSAVVLLEDGSVSAYAIHDTQMHSLELPSSLSFNGSSFSAGGSIFVHSDCPVSVFHNLETLARTLGPRRLPVFGGQITYTSARSINDIFCVVRPDKRFEFWHCAAPTPILLFTIPMADWLPDYDVNGMHMLMDQKMMLVRLGPCVVAHELVMPSEHQNNADSSGQKDGNDEDEDLDVVLARLDATMNQVMENSNAITDLISQSSPAEEKDARKDREDNVSPNKKAQLVDVSVDVSSNRSESEDHDDSESDSGSDEDDVPQEKNKTSASTAAHLYSKDTVSKENIGIWLDFSNPVTHRISAGWRPLFQARHLNNVMLAECSRSFHILATATIGHIHVIDTLTGCEIITQNLALAVEAGSPKFSPGSPDSTVSASIMRIVTLLVGNEPNPQPSILVATDTGSLLAYPIALDPKTRNIRLSCQTIFVPKNWSSPSTSAPLSSSQQQRSDSNPDKPVYFAALDQDGKLMRNDRDYTPRMLSEQYLVVTARAYAYVLLKERGKPVQTLAQRDIARAKEHIAVSRVAYILGDVPHLVSVTSNARLIVHQLPGLDMVASIALPEKVDPAMLDHATLSNDGRMGFWTSDGVWEMISLVADTSNFPKYESRIYDMHCARQWTQAHGIRVAVSGRNADHDALFSTKGSSNRKTSASGFRVSSKNDDDLESTIASSSNAFSRTHQQLNERGEKLEKLEAKFSDLADASHNFHEFARALKEHEENKKWWQI